MNRMHRLDNPIWQALISTHAHFAEAHNGARKFPHQVSVLAGFCEPAPESYNSLAALLHPDERVGLFLEEPPNPPAPWTIDRTTPLLQMLCERRNLTEDHPKPAGIPLTQAHVPEMLALPALTNPCAVAAGLQVMGDYFGIGIAGTLAAM